jgi:hypothetical protein
MGQERDVALTMGKRIIRVLEVFEAYREERNWGLGATRYGLTAVASVAGIGTSYESPRL